jgi:hypothetical protein
MTLLRSFVPFAIAVTIGALGCTTYRDQLARGQRSYELNEHDRTLAILRDLEPDMTRLSGPEQAQYAYLRGMSDYRIGYKTDARHWLSVAKAREDGTPGVLPSDWKARALEALGELNGVVYSQGTSALPTSRTEGSEEGKALAASGSNDPSVGAKDAKKDGRGKKSAPSDSK